MLKDERVISWRDELKREEHSTLGSSETDNSHRPPAMAPFTADRNKRSKFPSSTYRPRGLTTMRVILGLTAFSTLALVISLALGVQLQSARSLRSTSVLDRLLGKASSLHPSELDRFIKAETPIAIANILRNIGPAAGAADGLVIASPSWGEWADEPDYYYTWTRDSALTISSLLPDFLPSAYLRAWTYSVPSHNDSFTNDPAQPLVEQLIRAYVSSQAELQIKENPSGGLMTGGLNEPKFHVDGSRFDGDWGRPQRDGPALRALTLLPYAHFLLDRAWPADIEYVRDHLYDPSKLRESGIVIKNDLEEVAHGWSESGYDLWEEVDGHHLFTLLVSLRALQAGSIFAGRLNDTGAADYYTIQADKLEQVLPNFWDRRGYWKAAAAIGITDTDTLTQTKRSEPLEAEVEGVRVIGERLKRDRTGLDCAFPLTIIHAGQIRSSSEKIPATGDHDFSAIHERTLATLREYVLSFDGIYGINKGRHWTEGWALGRYAEDIYNGVGVSRGNPWFICTFSLAHTFYLAQAEFLQQGHIVITDLTRPFWADLLNDTKLTTTFANGIGIGARADESTVTQWWRKLWRNGGSPSTVDTDTWQAGSKNFQMATKRLRQVADNYMEIGQKYATEEGRISEQIDRSDGAQIGARDLTWSYASFLQAARARQAV